MHLHHLLHLLMRNALLLGHMDHLFLHQGSKHHQHKQTEIDSNASSTNIKTGHTIDEQNQRQRGVAVQGTKKIVKVLCNCKTSFISSTKRTHFTQNSPSKTESQTNFFPLLALDRLWLFLLLEDQDSRKA